MKRTIVLGITSGIAAYKVVDLANNLRLKGFELFVIMTDMATKMVSPVEFIKATGHAVYTSLFEKNFDYKKILISRQVEHIRLADSADIFVIAPATANSIGKIAHGIADDFLTTSILATQAPILICPSMNIHMWQNAAVQENLQILYNRGIHILHPDSGSLACGYKGIGRLAEISKIEKEIIHMLQTKNRLKGKKIIVTAGGTSEPIDSVRVITNKSSGKMGVALAEECYKIGADVLLLAATTSVKSRYSIRTAFFETGKDLEILVKRNAPLYEVIFHCAAVSDYKPEEKFDQKLDSTNSLILHLETTTKILSQIKKWNPKITLIGFKAVYKETETDALYKGKEKLKISNADFIVLNDVGKTGIGFGTDDNEVYIISSNGKVKKLDKASKKEIARKMIDYILRI